VEEQEDEDYDNSIEDGRQLQQKVEDDVAAALMTRKFDNIYLSSKEYTLLPRQLDS